MDDAMKLKQFAADVMAHGPNRVMISADEAVPSLRARREHGINPDVVFIRNNGWSLGAPKHLESEARAQWLDQWIGIIRRPSSEAIPFHV